MVLWVVGVFGAFCVVLWFCVVVCFWVWGLYGFLPGSGCRVVMCSVSVFCGAFNVLWWQFRGVLCLCTVVFTVLLSGRCFGVGDLYMVFCLIQGCAVGCRSFYADGFCVVGWTCGFGAWCFCWVC